MNVKFSFRQLGGTFALLSLFFLLLYFWKLSGAWWISGISDHMSNFALTGFLSLVIIGPRAFGSRNGRTKVLIVSALFMTANLAVEFLSAGTLGGFNVTDMYDAFYGIGAGLTIICAYYLTTVQKELN